VNSSGKKKALKTMNLIDAELKSQNSLSEGVFYGLTEHCRSGSIINLYEATLSFALRRAEWR